jgi:hypothetical protein
MWAARGGNLFLRSIGNKIVGVATDPSSGAAVVTREFGDRFAEVDYKTSGGRDCYNSLQTTLNRRFSKGLTLGSQWTWARSIGTSAGSNESRTAQNPYDFNADRGNNNFDVRHSFNLSALYELPSGKGGRVLGGWEVGAVVNARTGLPIEVLAPRNDVVYRDSRTGAVVNNPIQVEGAPVTTAIINTPGGGASRNIRRPDVVPAVGPYLEGGDKRAYLNPAAFAIPVPGAFGNLSRNALHGPGLAQFDLTFHKKFRLAERTVLEFRSEIYNLFNRANFANPPSTLANSLGVGDNRLQPGRPFTPAAAGGAFGVFNRTVERTVGLGASRQVQVSLRISF